MASELSEYEKLRLKNIAERQQSFDEFMKENGQESFDLLKAAKQGDSVIKPKQPPRQCVSEPTLERQRRVRNIKISEAPYLTPIRRSSRSTKSRRNYSDYSSENEENCSNDVRDDTDYSDGSDFKTYRSIKKVRRASVNNSRVLLPVAEVTDEMLANIAHTSKKKYSTEYGSSCHQCRQKTMDTKTVCRSPNCFGIRGQFCGPCLKNRYGESVADALLDPEWSCPVCRDLCNCSICRNRNGLKPTGIIVPLLRNTEHSNVSDFLRQFS